MTTFQHAHQLRQLKRIDPTIAQKAEVLLKEGFVDSATRIIIGAMQAALTRLTDPREIIWQTILNRLETKNTPVINGAQVEVGQLGSQRIFIFKRTDGKLALYDGLSQTTTPIAYWGKDIDNISSVQSGKWCLTNQAREIFDNLLAPKPDIARKHTNHRAYVK